MRVDPKNSPRSGAISGAPLSLPYNAIHDRSTAHVQHMCRTCCTLQNMHSACTEHMYIYVKCKYSCLCCLLGERILTDRVEGMTSWLKGELRDGIGMLTLMPGVLRGQSLDPWERSREALFNSLGSTRREARGLDGLLHL